MQTEVHVVADIIENQSVLLASINGLLMEKKENDPSDIRTFSLVIDFFNNCTLTSKEYMAKVLNETCIMDVLGLMLGGSEKKTINVDVL